MWKSRLIKPGYVFTVLVVISRKHLSSTSGPHSNIPEEILLMVQRNLIALHSFLEGNPHLFHSTTGDYSGARAAPASDQEAWKVATFSSVLFHN